MAPGMALLLLLHLSHGARIICDPKKDDALCYGAAGGILNFRLMDIGSTTDRYTWKKNTLTIFQWKNNAISINMLQNRSEFNWNTGVFQMRNLSRDDSDSYTLSLHEQGRLQKTVRHRLIIQANVSSVYLKPMCSSDGEVKVTCSAERGDSPEFSWTLDGQNLSEEDLLSENEENDTIVLRQNTKGRLRCSVKNHVSEVHEELDISLCGRWPVMAASLTAVLMISIVAVALLCVLKKKCEKNKEEEQELTYADVRVLHQPRSRRTQPQTSETVIYSQVKISDQSQDLPDAVDNNCIYAKVRR